MESEQPVSNRYQWQAAFVSYCNGTPVDEISQIFDIPLGTLRIRMSQENWAKLREHLPLGTDVALPAKVNAKLELINENRRINLAVWEKARNHAASVIEALAAGKLKIKRTISVKAPAKPRKKKGDEDETETEKPREAPTSVTVESEPTPADWLTIITYLRTITEGTYRALGDFQGEKAGHDANASPTAPPAPSITIVLPAAIAAPREKRVSDSHVVDVEPVTAKTA